MSTQPKTFLTPEEYLEIERKAEFKSEYYGGKMFAMSGAKEGHNLIVGNLSDEIRRQLRPRGCRTYTNDMRVQVRSTGLYTYPDIVVVCEEPQFLDVERDTLLNPVLLVEVLSPSTEAYDRVGKFEHYQTLASLREYLIVSSDRVRTELFSRQQDSTWQLTVASQETERVELASLQFQIGLGQIYEQVVFPPSGGQRPLIRS